MFRKMFLFGCLVGMLVAGSACETVCYTVYPITGCNSGDSGFPPVHHDSATANGQPIMAGGTIQVDGDGNIQFDFSGIPGAHRVEIIGPDGTHYIFDTLVFTWHPPSGGAFTINVLNEDGDVIMSWQVTIQIVVVVIPPTPPTPPAPVQPTVVITSPANNSTFGINQNISFSATAVGVAPFHYHWFFPDGSIIDVATSQHSNTVTKSFSQLSDSGLVYIQVTDSTELESETQHVRVIVH